MPSASVPRAWRRLWRDRPRVLAVGLLALTAVAASGLQSTAALVLRATLDEGWRGPYDILLTQGGKNPVDDGMLRTDATVDASTGRLGFDDLAFIRSLPGVEVAAPIALVAVAPSDLVGSPAAWVPIPVDAAASLERPEAFRVTIASTTTDATGERHLAEQSITALAYQPVSLVIDAGPDGDPAVVAVPEGDGPALLAPDGTVRLDSGAYDPATGTIAMGLAIAPRPAASVLLVDPAAERELLGDRGAFLDPLLADIDGRSPLLVQERAQAPLQVTVTVERLQGIEPGSIPVLGADAGVSGNGAIPPRIPNDPSAVTIAEYEFDGSPLLDPFAGTVQLLGGLDGDAVEVRPRGRSVSVPRSVLGGDYRVEAATRVLLPRGYAWFGGYSQAPITAAPTGSVTDYARLFGAVGANPALIDGIGAGTEIVGGFRAEDVFGDAIARAPLGGYELASPTLDGVALPTSLTGFGVPGTNPLAIGTFDLLGDTDGQRPITAIRIRVAGIDAYTPEAQQRLLQAAAALQSFGYTATIVAGSSPEPVPVTVAGYAFAQTDAAGRQPLGDLGVIEQPWSRLGAVVGADAAVSATSVALLVACVVAVGLLLAVVQLSRVPQRRDAAGVLRCIGWRRGRILRWYLAEDAIALGVLVVIGAASVLLATVPVVAAAGVGFTIALAVVTALIAAVAGSRAVTHARVVGMRSAGTSGRRPAPRSTGVHAPRTLGLRRARVALGSGAILGVALTVIVVCVALACAAFVQGRELAGPSVLGVAASTRAWLPQGVLAALALAAAVALAVLVRRASLERSRDQLRALTAMGWSRADLARMLRTELAVTAVPGLLVGLGIAAGIAVQLPGLLAPVLAAAVVGGALAVAVVLLAGRGLD
ncbi:hypothetical protein PYV02_11170 [Leifsonia sp. H3M29-4]|uniref:ABC transporter permease n=1 Tax=Salinibacterium metalliresistens TaxID=3031321 RepID=UPI0023D9A350|nr:hypothetical protein [Salinibacterium metalliresistens]MDF1479642.1 hypothetical protein [Salinibacterium metalliresistens]